MLGFHGVPLTPAVNAASLIISDIYRNDQKRGVSGVAFQVAEVSHLRYLQKIFRHIRLAWTLGLLQACSGGTMGDLFPAACLQEGAIQGSQQIHQENGASVQNMTYLYRLSFSYRLA